MKEYYENTNAKTNCPKCDSINTYYKKNVLICNECGFKIDMKLSKKSKQVISALTGITIILMIIFLTI